MFVEHMKNLSKMTIDKVVEHQGEPETAYHAWVMATKIAEINIKVMVETARNLQDISESEGATLAACMMGYMIDDLGRALSQLENQTLTGETAWQQLKLTIPETTENTINAFFGAEKEEH